MDTKLNKWTKAESGITALETAIILIAFVVVAAIFAFSVLTTGTFLTERSKEAAYSGLQEVRGSMEMKGSVVLTSDATTQRLIFNLSNVAGGSSQDLSKARVTFRDTTRNVEMSNKADGTKTAANLAGDDFVSLDLANTANALQILDQGKLAKIIVQLSTDTYVTSNNTLTLEVKPQTGGVLLIERTIPAQMTAVTDLH
jgi:archaeal flagellin FlaB